jgi:thioredoxin 1
VEAFLMSKPKDIGTEDFTDEVEMADIPVLVDFWAEWCGPCKQLAPRIEELAEEYDGQVKFVKVDVDDNQELAGQFGIRSIPSLLLFDEGEKVDQIVGSVPKEQIEEKLEEVL